MLLAIAFAVLVMGAGYAALRLLQVGKGAVSLGLAAPTGLSVLAILTSWVSLLRLPWPTAGAVWWLIALIGVIAVVHDRAALLNTARLLWLEQRVATVTLGAAVLVPLVATGIAMGGAPVPLSPHDGAAHTEAVQAFRTAAAWSNWYPPGLAALFAGFLQLVPWVDSAQGTVDLGFSLAPLAVLAVFGLGVAVWRDVLMAAVAALLLGLTYLYPYFPQI